MCSEVGSAADAPPKDEVDIPLIEELSDRDLAWCIKKIPADYRRQLALGPVEEPDCQVCDALNNKDYQPGAQHTAGLRLMDYHDTPIRRPGTVARLISPAGRETYERCVRIYRAAGWDG